jgi:hypothetical protein
MALTIMAIRKPIPAMLTTNKKHNGIVLKAFVSTVNQRFTLVPLKKCGTELLLTALGVKFFS